ncbi:MAG TPA: hypothetical protein VJ724_12810 [Tahibacter sp.]|nr:hypothetical protein [Tahibacter sp.]
MKSLNYKTSFKHILGFASATALAAAAPLAGAQNFETYYGEAPSSEVGQDIKSIRYCPNGGTILVGSRREANGTQAQVTRVDNNGVAMWQYAYSVANNAFTTGNAIVELTPASTTANGGFALTGAVAVSGLSIYVLHISCEGRPLWTTILANQSTLNRATGYDIIEATNPLGPVRNTELVVVGDEVIGNAIGTSHGRIARLNAATGGPLWNLAYIRNGTLPGLRFRAVTESVGTAIANDLVVAGSAAAGQNWANDRRALIFRTTWNGAPVCNNTLGRQDPINNDFYGIVELAQPAFAGDDVLVGSMGGNATGAVMLDQVYMGRFGATTCVPQVEALWRDIQDGAVAYDVAEDLIDPATRVTGIRATGTIQNPFTAGDGFLLSANPITLGPFIAQFRYSTQSARHENLQALDNKKDRYVMLGSTLTDWDGVGDPSDFYMVQTDPNGKTQCVREWIVEWTRAAEPQERFEPSIREMRWTSTQTSLKQVKDEGYCCRLDPN